MGAVLYAAMKGHVELWQWLLSAGEASITERDDSGFSALLLAIYGHPACAQWLLEEGGSSIEEMNTDGDTVWDRLKPEGANADALASLLKVVVLLAEAPSNFVAKLSPVHDELVTRGQQFRAQLPSYLD
jgi:hypothetical protein